MTRLARPSHIGPYRLEERLGVGGMGEVYAAWDERLGRRVAVKLIRPEAEVSESARERFRREARSAAALNHPAIVQLYDLVTLDGGEALVLELVEGETLERRLRQGPLPPHEVLGLAQALASALAAAHARGLVHRDLKPANVMLTPSGLPKVLDFGVAKRLGGEGDEHTLSEAGGLVGTPWAMSPEQARGLPVDHRSDLFALGALLYEAATSEHPFRSTTTLDSLNRVCTHQPPPAIERAPGLPPALSALIDHLLEKDPARRPQQAEEVAHVLDEIHLDLTRTLDWPSTTFTGATRWSTAVLPPTLHEGQLSPLHPPTLGSPGHGTGEHFGATTHDGPGRRRGKWLLVALGIVLAGLAGWQLAPRSKPVPRVVAVPRPELTSPGIASLGAASATAEKPATDEMADSLRLSLLRGLLGLAGLSTPAPEQVDEVQGGPAEVARALAADEVLSSRLSCQATTCNIVLSRIGADGALLWTQGLSVPRDQPYLLPEAVAGYLKTAYAGRPLRGGLAGLEARPEDFAEYLRLETAYQRQGEGVGLDQLLARLEGLRASSPRFLEPMVFEAQLRRYRFRLTRDPIDLARARELLLAARELAPADPRPLLVLFEVALAGENVEQARGTLAELERLQPGDPGLLSRRARLLEREGKTVEALAEMRRAARQQPSWHHLFRLADMEYRLGEHAAARKTLETLLDRFPGSYAGRSLLAQIELLSGNAERAAALYEKLVAEHHGVEELTNLAAAYLLLADYPRAAASSRDALASDPGSPWARLNLADATLLGGDEAAARGLYEEILATVEKDSAPGWELLSLQAQALAHLGRKREAVNAVQQVQRLAPDNPQAAYETAVALALIGDPSSALAAVENARLGGRGVAVRWFSLPWFDPLRDRGDFAALMAEPPPG